MPLQRPDTTIARILESVMPDAITDHQQQLTLMRAAQAGDAAAKKKLLLGSIGLVVRMVAPFLTVGRSVGLEAADLLTAGLYGPEGDGRTGLSRAIDLFDCDRGVRLSTYAQFWVRDAVGRLLRCSGVVRLPDLRPRNAIPEIGRVAVDEETLGTTAEDESTEFDAARLGARLQDAIETVLDERERYIIRRRYSRSEASLIEIAAELDISRERVRQLEATALEKLRDCAELVDIEPPMMPDL